MAISCVYCGGTHDRPVEVKQCWAEHEGATGASVGSEPAEPTIGEPADRVVRSAARYPVAAPAPVDDGLPAQVVAVRRGPGALGRHVVVLPGAAPPADWVDTPRVTVDAAACLAPGPVVERLRAAAHAAESLTIEVAPDAPVAGAQPPDERDERDPYEVGPTHRFVLDELHHLVHANAIDVRDTAAPRWRAVDLAVARGASLGGAADVVLPDGSEVWLDGGPVRHHDPVDGVAVLHAVAVEHGALSLPGPNVTTADLAPDQRAAVGHVGGAARIIAPAGSGKTRVLTERARHLLTAWNLPASAVTLVAFNKRAQQEMSARTADLRGLEVRTLNSIALAILNGAPPFAPQARSWRTVDEPEVRRQLGRFVETPRRLNVDPIAPWIEALGLVRLGLVDPATVELRAGGDVDGLTEVYPRYVEALERAGNVDFDGQIHGAIRVLLTDPSARRAAQRACRVLLVDEFQDLTPAHLLMIRLLAAPGGAVFAVGDDDQTIYGYQGADPSWLIDFGEWFPGAGDHPLEVNYRCPGGIVDVADRLLRHNRRRVDKTIRAASGDPGGWRAVVGDDPVGETVGAVRAALDAGARPGEIAVLTRVNASLAPVQAGLHAAGVPVTGGVGGDFLDRTSIRAALAWLRLAGPGGWDPADLGEALRRPSRGLHPRVRDWVAEQRDLDGLDRLARRLTNDKDTAKVESFAAEIGALSARVARGASTAELLRALCDEVGLAGAVAGLDRTRGGMNRSAQGDDLTALRHLAGLHPETSTFGRWLREQLMIRRDDAGVVLATVHRVKGQEWPHVVVHLADADQFPHRLADDVEEERRLFHVAITRAARAATIVAEQPSPFIAELTTEPSAHAPEPPGRERPRPVARPSAAAPDHPLLDRERVFAVPGLVLVDQGQSWTVVELEPEAAVARLGGSTRRFPIGAQVVTAGRQRGRLSPRPGQIGEASVRAFDALRGFRDGARNGKPAYTVFDDKTLAAIAAALPNDPTELAAVKGVGPAKLERFGEAVLDVVAEAVEPGP